MSGYGIEIQSKLQVAFCVLNLVSRNINHVQKRKKKIYSQRNQTLMKASVNLELVT